MIIPMRYSHFGHQFKDQVDTFTKHSGVDLNFGAPYEDMGMPIKAMAAGSVVYSEFVTGWGNLMVIYHPEYKVWSRYAHLEKRSYAKGAEVKEGDIIGYCGNTGGKWAPHLHWDVIIKMLPKGWAQYTKYWSNAKVMEHYTDPIPYVNGINAQSSTVSDWAENSVQKSKETHIIDEWDFPQAQVSNETIRYSLYKAGVLEKEPKDPLTQEQWAVIMDNLKLLDKPSQH